MICTGQNRFSGIFYIDAYNHLHNLSHFSAKCSYDDSLCDYTILYSFVYSINQYKMFDGNGKVLDVPCHIFVVPG